VDRRFLRPGWLVGHLLVVVSFVVCCRLGVWQWDRTHDADGTLQNLSYAILWPVFGIAFIYMWIRFLLLERAKDAADDQDLDQGIATILAQGGAAGDSGAAPAVGAEVGTAPAGTAQGAEGLADDRAAADGAERDGDDDAGNDGPTVDDDRTGIDDEEDPEMAAYNRALAALAERDEHRGS
jgi:hypothetical protein